MRTTHTCLAVACVGLSRDDLPRDEVVLPPREGGSTLVMKTPFHELRGFDASSQVILDSMHTIGGVLKALWCLLQNLRENIRVHAYEAETNHRRFDGVHLASKIMTSYLPAAHSTHNPQMCPQVSMTCGECSFS